MDLIHSVILGIVEGITEFLPISSTGHMILTSYLLKIHGPVVDAFEVFIQLGAILAVVVLYKHRFACLFDFKSRQGFSGVRGLSLLAVTSLPVMIIGFLARHAIKDHLFNPFTVSCALGLGGIILLFIERVRFKNSAESIDGLDYRQAFKIGCFQCLALWPGVSRSASTIIGGLFSGLPRTTAAEYSFLAAVPVMIIACLKDLLDVWNLLSPNDILTFAVGFVVAFIFAMVAVKTFIVMLQRTSLAPFGVYRIIVAVAFFWLMRNQVLPH